MVGAAFDRPLSRLRAAQRRSGAAAQRYSGAAAQRRSGRVIVLGPFPCPRLALDRSRLIVSLSWAPFVSLRLHRLILDLSALALSMFWTRLFMLTMMTVHYDDLVIVHYVNYNDGKFC